MKKNLVLSFLFCVIIAFAGSEKAANAKKNMFYKRDSRDILGKSYEAVLIPSSQAKDDIKACVEQCMDGKTSTIYRSGLNTFPNWVEARWPYYATVDGARILFRDRNAIPEYIRFEARTLNGKWSVLKTLKGKAVTSDHIVLPKTDCSDLRVVFGPAPCGRTELRELEITGTAPKRILPRATWQGNYIWYPDERVDNVTRYFRRTFHIDSVKNIASATLQVAADDIWDGWLNGKKFGRGGVPSKIFDALPLLKDGKNVFAFQVKEFSIDEGLLIELNIRMKDGKSFSIITDSKWLVSREAAGEWQKIDYDDSKWVIAKANTRSKAGVAFRPEVRRPENIIWKSIDLPEEVRPGQKIRANLTFECTENVKEDWGFRVTLGEIPLVENANFRLMEVELFPAVKTSAWQKGRTYTIPVELYIPTWAPHGKTPLNVTAVSGSSQDYMTAPENAVLNIKRFSKPIQYPKTVTKAEVRMVGDGPRLFVNGKPVAPYVFADNYVHSLKVYGAHTQAGAVIYRMKLADNNFFAPTPEERERKMQHVLKALDQKIDLFIRQQPDGLILLGAVPCPAYDWNAAYPDDLTRHPNGKAFNHSFSSERYIRETEEGFRRIIRHVLASKYASRVIGFNVQLGDGPETYYWGAAANRAGTPREKLQMGDVSKVAVAAFRQWLRKKYNNDVKALRAAWKMPKVTFETATPDVKEFRREDTPVFRDPAKGRMAMDFWEFQSDAVAKTVIALAKVTKEETKGRWIFGTMGFYNTSMNHTTSVLGVGQQKGYTGIMQVMESPYIDYIASIQGYAGVNDGTPVGTLLTIGSMRRRNKFFLEEYDCRTFMTDLTFSVVGHHGSVHESRRILTRNVGKSLANDHAYWWNGHTLAGTDRRAVGWYDDDGIQALTNYCSVIQQEAMAYPFYSAAEVGVFYNNRDIVTMDPICGDPVLASTRYNFIIDRLSALGIPFELNCLEDLNEKAIQRYKVIVIADAYYLDTKCREEIRKTLKKTKKSVVWFYAPGLVDTKSGISVRNSEQLTGFALNMEKGPLKGDELKVSLSGKDPLLAGLEGGSITPRSYMYDRRILTLGPVLTVKPGDGVVLGKFAKSGKTAIAVKRNGKSLNVFCAIPDFPAGLFRAVCKEAGVHLYSSEPVFLEASKRFISIHTTAAGFRGYLRLPEAKHVLDVFTLKTVSDKAVTGFRPDIVSYGSKVYFLGTAEEVKDFADKLRKRMGGPLKPLPVEKMKKRTGSLPCSPTDEAVLNPVEGSEWTGAVSKLSDTREGNANEYILQVQGRANLFSAHTLPIDPKKTYRLSGRFRTVPGTKPSNFFFGVQPYDAKGRVILPHEVNVVPNSETVLLKDAKAGSFTLIIRKNKAWKAGKQFCVAFNTDPSGEYNDLPNRTVTKIGIESIKDEGDAYRITLSHPLQKNWSAGTYVRQHKNSYLYIYNAGFARKVPEKWQTISGTVGGEEKAGIKHSRHWWRGTRYARIVLLMNNSGNNSNAVHIQDIRLEEINK